MQLTRRDAILALAAGAGVGAGAGAREISDAPTRDTPSGERREDPDEGTLETLVATAEVIYPSAVEGIGEFTRTYVSGLPPERLAAVDATVSDLERHVLRTRGRPFSALSVEDRDTTLRALGVSRVAPRSDGALPERVRYYVVNQLLYGLYSCPTGSRLVGIENPVGHPGGYQSYQKPPSK
jgi:hypothetical protein